MNNRYVVETDQGFLNQRFYPVQDLQSAKVYLSKSTATRAANDWVGWATRRRADDPYAPEAWAKLAGVKIAVDD